MTSPSSAADARPDHVRATIKPISKGDVHRITSGQVVLDLQTAVKELVENALDAGATNIEVRFKDYGADSFEVIDNGTGIDATNYDGIALKHHTSKLAAFSDLAMVQTFGFRGEALSSLCALSQVTLHTATADEAPVGTLIELDHAGSVRSSHGKAARQRGTTVTVVGLFKSLPVRRKEFEKNLKREYAKAQNLLQAYALISQGVRWTSTNQPKAGRKVPQFSVNSSASANYLVSNVAALFGARLGPTLMPLDLSLSFAPVRSHLDARYTDDLEKDRTDHQSSHDHAQTEMDPATTVKVTGAISKPLHGHGRSSADRQFFYINGRPWEAGRISRAFNEIYKSYNTNQSPFVVADFRLPTDSYDVNVSPDKRTIFLHEEARLVEKVKEGLDRLFAPTRGVFVVGGASQSLRASSSVQSKLTSFEAMSREGKQQADDVPSEGKEDQMVADEEANGSSGESSEAGSERVGRSVGEASAGTDRAGADVAPELDEIDGHTDVIQDTLYTAAEGGGGGLPIGAQDRAEDSSSSPQLRSPPSDTEDEDVPGSPPKRSHETTLDTTQASWSPVKRIRLSSPHATSSSSLSEPLTAGVPYGSGRRRDRPKVDLIKSLSSYALPGSQIAEMLRTRDGDPTESDEGDVQRLEYAEDDGDDPRLETLSSIVGSEPEEMADTEPLARFDDVGKDGQGCDCDHGDEAHPVLADETRGDGEADSEERRRNLAALDADDEDDDGESTGQGSLPESVPLQGSSDASLAVATSSTGIDVLHIEHLDEATSRDRTVSFDLDALRRRLLLRHSLCAASASRKQTRSNGTASERDHPAANGLLDAGVGNRDAAEVETSLSRVLHKADFAAMDVVGQFNLGFIIARRRSGADPADSDGSSGAMDDLFIVDQHASDEKYNFETLQLETRIQSQRLILPRALELSASDELVASEHVDTLRRNGFEVEVLENGLPGRRVRLLAQPVSRGTVFGVKDLEELLYLLRDVTPSSPAAQTVRCSKARAMFASRACRKSVMIGTALKPRQMRRILQHMGEIEQPWNCPHGRPTMRHLVCLRTLGQRDPPSGPTTTAATTSKRHGTKKVDWSTMR